MENVTIKITGKNYNCTFGVTTLPNRKHPCLYKMRGAMLEPLAYFRCQEDADTFNEILNILLKAYSAMNELSLQAQGGNDVRN